MLVKLIPIPTIPVLFTEDIVGVKEHSFK